MIRADDAARDARVVRAVSAARSPRAGWAGAALCLAVLTLAGLVLAAAMSPTAAGDDGEAFRAAIRPLYGALTELQVAAVAGAPGLEISRLQSVVFHERERLHARYGARFASAPDREVADALETAYLSFTLYGLLVGQFGARVGTENAAMDRHFQRGVAAMETIDRFLRSR